MSAHLVVVDAQAVFADPASPWAVPRFPAIVAPVRRLAAAFEGRRTFTRFVAPDRPTGTWAAYYERFPFARTGPEHPQYALVPELADLASDVVAAPTFGKWGAELAGRVEDAADLVVCGVSTDCCVLSTVLAAADAGHRVRLVTDACAGATDADHDRALAVMALYAPLVELVAVADLA